MRSFALALAASVSIAAIVNGPVLAAPAAPAAFPNPLPEEPIPAVETLPAHWPSSWVLVHDFHFGSLLDIKPVIGFHRGESAVVHKDRGFDRTLLKLFDRTRAAMAAGLATPLVNCSYAGDLAVIRRNPLFIALENDAGRRGITVLLSMMSVTGALNVGPGAFALSYIDGPPLALPTASEADEEAQGHDPGAVDWVI